MSAEPRVWYEAGLRFSCTQCGNCCRNHGEYAFVNLSPRDVEAIASFLGLDEAEFLRRYCDKQPGHFPTLRMDAPQCPFLDEASRCKVYPVRPMQCRTWPFWRSNLERETWEGAVSARCPGIGSGPLYTRREIEERADATERGFGATGR